LCQLRTHNVRTRTYCGLLVPFFAHAYSSQFRLEDIVADLKNQRRPIFWQEVFDHNIPENNSIIHVWKGSTHQEIMSEVKNVTAKGYGAIVSACWYLNYIKYGADWKDAIPGTVPSNSRYFL
ncbi:hypothetical protein OESDEN_08074, partial [Oesophagostomum dentatum]